MRRHELRSIPESPSVDASFGDEVASLLHRGQEFEEAISQELARIRGVSLAEAREIVSGVPAAPSDAPEPDKTTNLTDEVPIITLPEHLTLQ